MANKIDAKLILELLQIPMSQREIIKTRHISSKSITAVCRRAAELGVSYADLADNERKFYELQNHPNCRTCYGQHRAPRRLYQEIL